MNREDYYPVEILLVRVALALGGSRDPETCGFGLQCIRVIIKAQLSPEVREGS